MLLTALTRVLLSLFRIPCLCLSHTLPYLQATVWMFISVTCLESCDTFQGSSDDLIYTQEARGLSNGPMRANEGVPPLPSSSTIFLL